MEDEIEPSEIQLEEPIFDIAFHPSEDLISIGLISGTVEVYRYSCEENNNLFSEEVHQGACRALKYNSDGTFLYSGGADNALKAIDTNTLQVVYNDKNAHETSINRLLTNENLVFTGDDEGTIKIWDARKREAIFTFEDNTDFITDLYFTNEKYLLATSGDGCLARFNIKRGKCERLYQSLEDELLSVITLKYDTIVVAGSQQGELYLFNWDNYSEPSEKFVGHPNSIDTMLPVNENIMITGSSDGIIRVLQIRPNKLLGIIGEHQDYPIEKIQVCNQRKYLASCSHDETVKFWNVAYLFNDTVDEEEVEVTDNDENEGENENEEEQEEEVEGNDRENEKGVSAKREDHGKRKIKEEKPAQKFQRKREFEREEIHSDSEEDEQDDDEELESDEDEDEDMNNSNNNHHNNSKGKQKGKKKASQQQQQSKGKGKVKNQSQKGKVVKKKNRRKAGFFSDLIKDMKKSKISD